MRYGRVDNNQSDIVKRFKELGVSVFNASSVGGGLTDLIVGKWGINILVEVKDGIKKKNNLTPEQIKFHNEWQGSKVVIHDASQCEQLFLKMRHAANLIDNPSALFKLD